MTIKALDLEEQEYLPRKVRSAYILGAAKKLLSDEEYEKYERKFGKVSEDVERMSKMIAMDEVFPSTKYDPFESARHLAGLVVSHTADQKERRYIVWLPN